jgi:hypothetical protein
VRVLPIALKPHTSRNISRLVWTRVGSVASRDRDSKPIRDLHRPLGDRDPTPDGVDLERADPVAEAQGGRSSE